MLPESEIRKLYEESIALLEECDSIPESRWTMERYDAFDRALAKYEVLHKILEIGGEKRWNS